MKVEYYIIIGVLVFVVILGSILLYVFAHRKDKNTQSFDVSPANNDGSYNNYNSDLYLQTSIDEANEKNQRTNQQNISAIQLTAEEMSEENISVLKTVLKIKNKNIIRFSEPALKTIFLLYGNLQTSYENILYIYDQQGKLLLKIQFFPETNNVIVNDWHQAENVMASNTPWPKQIMVSISKNLVRVNNTLIFEYPNDTVKVYTYMKLDTKGVKDLQLISINDRGISPEEVIKRDR